MYPPNQTPPDSVPPDSLPPATEQPSSGTAWPPAQPQAGIVWPPPPAVTGANQGPMVSVPFKEEYRRVKGNVSDFRMGTITLSSSGVDIQGKMAPRAEVRVPIVILCVILLRVIGGLIAHYVIDYCFRRDAFQRVPWADVLSIVVSSKHQRACLVFNAPNQVGKVKLFSLAWRMQPGEFAQFTETAGHYAGDRLVEGKVPGATSLILWIVFAIVVAIFLMILGFYLYSSLTSGHH